MVVDSPISKGERDKKQRLVVDFSRMERLPHSFLSASFQNWFYINGFAAFAAFVAYIGETNNEIIQPYRASPQDC
jgi:hypothetical protein